ncbi:DEKNAAC103392 [Brettanomyces naardenensis]|uniref:DEKNAAC103392 n=1 Tax=Brettanomyces naardenensis TaxID=13370 RepID=A0A448YMZ4_BRENA|nr:DEKNAAC103392 [Brettanomyces naardenensis]
MRGAKVENNVLTFKDGLRIQKGDCIYMICEPPSEPFYIAMLTGFSKKDKAGAADGKAPSSSASNYMFEVLWFYRPRDISRHSTDSRLLYATVHKDLCPIQSFRGFVTVKHTSEIEDLELYKQQNNCFYFDKLYDRYMMKTYDVVPTKDMTNLPPNYYKALNKRYGYVFMETGHGEDLMNEPQNCEKCHQWCPSSDSIQCFQCGKTYHLMCLDPPILTKPKRGFAWYCAACTREMEDELDAKRGDMLRSSLQSQILADMEREKEEIMEDEEKGKVKAEVKEEQELNIPSHTIKAAPKYEQLAIKFLENDTGLTQIERRKKEEWPWRYLGVHARLEDAMDLQDRPYPRASSRLGSRYQCTGIPDWYEHTVQYYDEQSDKQKNRRRNNGKNSKGGNKRSKSQSPSSSRFFEEEPLAKKRMPVIDEYAHVDPKEYPGWLQPRPTGYFERGSDETATLMWEPPKDKEEAVESYIEECSCVAEKLNLLPNTPNFVDAILKLLLDKQYRFSDALVEVRKLTREKLKEPTFSAEEVKRFEDSVKIHGDELYPVYKDVGTQSSAMVVRFYYLWKKTKNGHQIWDNYPYRPKNRLKYIKNTELDLDDSEDDAAYSSTKIVKKEVQFECVFCHSTHSAQWFRAPGANLPKSKADVCKGLCYRCCRLWRRYAVEWENPEDLLKKKAQRGNGWWKKLEEELSNDCERILSAREGYSRHPRKANSNNIKTLEERNRQTIDGKTTRPLEKPIARSKSSLKIKRTPSPSFEVTIPFADKRKRKREEAVGKRVVPKPKQARQAKQPKESKPAKLVAAKVKQGSSMESYNSLLARMSSRYDSKYEVFNPFTNKSIEDLPLLQTRNAMREISLLWRVYESSQHKTRVSSESKLARPLFDPSMRPCCVCRESGSLEEMLICSNCGLNVHASCYGIDLSGVSMDRPPYLYKWHCDTCSNDIHPFVSTQYVCCLCNARESDHDGAMHGDPSSVPDAFKRTSNGRWCHVGCAIFSEGTSFGDAESLQPVYGTELVNFANLPRFCAICGGNSGGLVDCRLCGKSLHVTCCQDSENYFVGFEILERKDVEDGKCQVTVEEKNGNVVTGVAIPTVVCPDHFSLSIQTSLAGKHLYSMRTKCKVTGRKQQMPLLKAYTLVTRRNAAPMHGGELRRHIYERMLEMSKSAKDSENKIELRAEDPSFDCIYCHNDRSLQWHNSEDGSTGKVCHQCYVRKQNNEGLTDSIPDLSQVNGRQLDGSKFGIPSLEDHVNSKGGSRMSIRDILC